MRRYELTTGTEMLVCTNTYTKDHFHILSLDDCMRCTQVFPGVPTPSLFQAKLEGATTTVGPERVHEERERVDFARRTRHAFIAHPLPIRDGVWHHESTQNLILQL